MKAFRNLRERLRARLAPGDHEEQWIGGTRLLVRRGMTSATDNVYHGLAEFHDMAFVLHLGIEV